LNLFELFVKIGAKDEASGNISKISEKLGSGLKTAAKIGTAAVSTAMGAVVALTKQAVESYAQYEQLVGGVQTLFGAGGKSVEEYAESVGKSVDEVKEEYKSLMSSEFAVLENAAQAYKSAGLSANAYLETVTSFSASLLQSLEGDTEAAADYADMAVTDMADNANKMGTSIESLQTTYAGFAKQNYTMLDNLNTMGALAA
jgi:phage-related protein